MYEFNYRKVDSVAAAVEAMQQAEDGKFVAGGQTMLPTMKHRLASPSDLIDLGGVAELTGISVENENLIVGAMTTHAAVAASAEVQQAIPALARLAAILAIRPCGTGNSWWLHCNHDPAADYPAAVIALGATVQTSKRAIPAEEFFTGMFETALEDDEIVTSVSFPLPEAAAYMKFENPASRYAIVGVFVAKTGGEVRVGVTGATACAHRGFDLKRLWAVSLMRRY